MDDDFSTIGMIAVVLLIAVPLVLGIAALGAWITMWAWNIFLVAIFHLPAINFWQALGANLLLWTIKGLVSVTYKK